MTDVIAIKTALANYWRQDRGTKPGVKIDLIASLDAFETFIFLRCSTHFLKLKIQFCDFKILFIVQAYNVQDLNEAYIGRKKTVSTSEPGYLRLFS